MGSSGFTQDGSVDIRGRPVLASRTGKWKACVFLLGYEAFERMAFYGVAANLVVYLTTQLHEDTVSSVRSVNNWTGSVWITPIIGAYIADTYAGRFWTFTVSAIVYILGMGLLTMAVSLKSLRPSCSADGVCGKATPSQMALFFSSLYIIALGAGGTKPNISTFGADQFDDFDAKERKLKSSFFNWWMFSSFFGGLLATLALVYIQENVGWGVGYGIPTAGLLVSLFIFYIGTPYYRHKVRKAENPMREMVRVWVAAFANRRLKAPADPSQLYELDQQQYMVTGERRVHHTTGFSFLDKAAIRGVTTGELKPCTVTQVEKAKLVLGMAVVWFATLVPSTIFAQVNTLFVKQGTTLRRTLGNGFQIPAASLASSVTISMLLSVPIYDRLFVPFMRRRTGIPGGITLLQRIGIGFGIQVLVTAVACAVEAKRIHVIKEHGITGPKEIVPMSIFWLLPQYVLFGVGDVFNAIGALEFFYDQSPEDMQSLGTTFFTSGIGLGNFLNSILVTVVDKVTSGGGKRNSWIANNLNDSHLDYYYAFLTTASAINLLWFMWISKGYHYKKETNEASEMKVRSCDQMEGKAMETSAIGLQA